MLSWQLNPKFTALENKAFGNGLLLLFISRYKRLILSPLVPSWTASHQFSSVQGEEYVTSLLPSPVPFPLLQCGGFLVYFTVCLWENFWFIKILFFLFILPSPNIKQQKLYTIKSNTHSFVLFRCGEPLLIRKRRKAKFSPRMMGVLLNSDNSWEILGKDVLAKIHSASDMLWINIPVSRLPRGVLLFLSPASDLGIWELGSASMYVWVFSP